MTTFSRSGADDENDTRFQSHEPNGWMISPVNNYSKLAGG
jgi:hypothetical protein